MRILRFHSYKLNESSYEDFRNNRANDLNDAVKKLKEISKIYDDKVETVSDKLEKLSGTYDEYVLDYIDGWSDGRVSVDDIVRVAIENQDRNGTEPSAILLAIDDVYNIFKK